MPPWEKIHGEASEKLQWEMCLWAHMPDFQDIVEELYGPPKVKNR